MLPYKTLIEIDREKRKPIYLQIVSEFMCRIRRGEIPTGTRLPGTRELSKILGVHRKTVVVAYEELQAQGWIEIRPARGTFVNSKIPRVDSRPLHPETNGQPDYPARTTYDFEPFSVIGMPAPVPAHALYLNDGFPDVRLAPLKALAREYRNVTKGAGLRRHMYYVDAGGNALLREELCKYLRDTRSLRIEPKNVLITRGSIMALYLLSQTLVRPGDIAVVGETNYNAADMNLALAGAQMHRIPVDQHGVDVDALPAVQAQSPIRIMYVAPHHHHPTTVTLTAERRVKLLEFAVQHKIALIEDDYDFDFHYSSSPILPLASADHHGAVVYIGSLSKNIAPAFRIGYVVGPENLISELIRLRRVIDRQGDAVLEQAVGMLFKEGEVRRHLRKALREYRDRRDLFCGLLREKMGNAVEFKVPEGGLAVWTRFAPDIDTEAS
ncbi:MAG: PLP-dependent aminotransferase family protein, partial [Bacteroidota bacterium]